MPEAKNYVVNYKQLERYQGKLSERYRTHEYPELSKFHYLRLKVALLLEKLIFKILNYRNT
jgi:hypothetical protein